MKNKNQQMLTTFVRSDGTALDGRPADFGAMAYMLTVLIVLNLMAVYYYGVRALLVALTAVGTCLAADIVCLIFRRKPLHIHDISAAITGLTLSAMLPASVPYTVAAGAAVFAVCIAKHPFGGHGHEIFNCAAAGYIFAELSYPSAVLSYPKPFSSLSLSNIVPETLTSSFTKSAMVASSSNYSDFELLIGNFTGPMGCTFTVLVLVCALVLISRKAISSAVFVTALGTVLLWSLITDGVYGLKTALAGGMLVFGIMALCCDYSLVPKTTGQRIMFGFASAVMIILVSEISSLENPVVYASVLSAPLARLTAAPKGRSRRRRRLNSIFGRANNEASAANDIGETIAMIGDNSDDHGQ